MNLISPTFEEHQRLNVFYTEAVLRLAEEKKVGLEGSSLLHLETIKRGDHFRLTQCLTDANLRYT